MAATLSRASLPPDAACVSLSYNSSFDFTPHRSVGRKPQSIYLCRVYQIIDVTVEAGEAVEPMGSKPKFWFEHPELGTTLFKAVRPGSGEDWSEKVAAEVAFLLRLPHAEYELAIWKGERGVITPRLTTDGEKLVHGNELLVETVPDYGSPSAEYRTPLHTVEAVVEAMESHAVGIPRGFEFEGVTDCADLFAGYLMLDALVGNTDRHHENWAVVQALRAEGEPEYRLAPTFDHASCLGRNEPIERIVERLGTKDRNYTVEAYAERAGSALFADPEDPRPLTPLA